MRTIPLLIGLTLLIGGSGNAVTVRVGDAVTGAPIQGTEVAAYYPSFNTAPRTPTPTGRGSV